MNNCRCTGSWSIEHFCGCLGELLPNECDEKVSSEEKVTEVMSPDLEIGRKILCTTMTVQPG